jgi:hypothetical protein
MIEQGLVALIQNGIASLKLDPRGNGVAVMLPKDLLSPGGSVTMAWTYRGIVSTPTYVLEGQDAYTEWEIQIDCHGQTMVQAMTLARAIDGVLRGGYSGTLPDPDNTRVFGIQRIGPYLDGYSDANRSFVRTLEYKIDYAQI